MAPALPEAAAASANTSTLANTGFRLGEEQQFSDASDSDQSQTSQRSASPRRANGMGPATKSKKKKQKDRRKMGALADELVDVLGDAFSAPQADLQTDSVQQPNGDQTMAIDSEPAGKKMNKRTRQNLARMQARKERKVANPKMDMSEDKTLQAQIVAAERRGMSLDEYRKISSGKGMSKAAARRAKKDAIRRERAAAPVDEMDIG
ncbi:hypothetical protein GT037_007674 [Alternaria burnsii]|uniref:Uncharacterized protein n=1 Tax=Alternaria burnsii TaxID=1187904 RepID=A0A8H7B2R8_9PLEO|nr:uncharacterized protein GT037_007674 [Alternaria burnsii]KAF7673908.1 hypothetical protein GT037_007674 [Alternaria burnsii]CAI9635365.1 unnamed protein product [Alternaria burnsii]